MWMRGMMVSVCRLQIVDCRFATGLLPICNITPTICNQTKTALDHCPGPSCPYPNLGLPWLHPPATIIIVRPWTTRGPVKRVALEITGSICLPLSNGLHEIVVDCGPDVKRT